MSERKGEQGLPDHVEFVSRGFRDVYWCPYLNEPIIVTYKMVGLIDKEPWCEGCNGPMSETDHWFICTIRKRPTQ